MYQPSGRQRNAEEQVHATYLGLRHSGVTGGEERLQMQMKTFVQANQLA